MSQIITETMTCHYLNKIKLKNCGILYFPDLPHALCFAFVSFISLDDLVLIIGNFWIHFMAVYCPLTDASIHISSSLIGISVLLIHLHLSEHVVWTALLSHRLHCERKKCQMRTGPEAEGLTKADNHYYDFCYSWLVFFLFVCFLYVHLDTL